MFQPSRFIYYLAKVFGLAPFKIGKNGIVFKSSIEILYPIVLAALCVTFSIFSTIYENRVEYCVGTFISRIVAVIIANLKVLSIIFFLLTSVFRRKDIAEIFNMLLKCDKTFELLGASQDLRNKRIGTSIYVVIAIFVIHILGQTMNIVERLINLEMEKEENRYTVFNVFQTVFAEWISNVYHIGIIIFVTVLLSVEQRFQQINETFLKACAFDYGQEPDFACQTNHEARFESTRIKVRIGDKKSLDASGNVTSIAISHDTLIDVIGKLISLFSIPMVLIICYYSVTITATYYHTLVLSEGLHLMKGSLRLVDLVHVHTNVVIFLVELFCIGTACYKTQETVGLNDYYPFRQYIVSTDIDSSERW